MLCYEMSMVLVNIEKRLYRRGNPSKTTHILRPPTVRLWLRERPLDRYRARLTAGGPDVKHRTRRLVPCGAHTAARSTSGHADRPHSVSTAAPSARADAQEEGSWRPFHRSRARLTAGGPDVKHLTRRLVSFGAHTAGCSTSGQADRSP